jgi:hypothetical protein
MGSERANEQTSLIGGWRDRDALDSCIAFVLVVLILVTCIPVDSIRDIVGPSGMKYKHTIIVYTLSYNPKPILTKQPKRHYVLEQ